jgi:Fic family protein
MSLPRSSWTSRSPLDAIRGRPASMRLTAYHGVERRDVVQRQALVRRLISEFDEMPGLRLSLAQASRLFGVSEAAAVRILTELTEVGMLQRTATNFYMRRDR